MGLVLFMSNSPNNNVFKDIIPNYNKNKVFTKINSAFIGSVYPWGFYLKEMICGDKSFTEDQRWVEIENDFSFLLGNNDYKAYIYEIFFNMYFQSNICSEKEWELSTYNKYYVIECNKIYFGYIDIIKFPNITFISRDLEATIKFEAKDLFTETEHKYFFNVIFSQFGGSKWIFGKLFLKKYPTMFNLDANTIEIYDGSEESDNNGSSVLMTILLIFGIIILLGAIGVLGYFFGKNLNKMRKKKANELADDEFDYTANNDNAIVNNNNNDE